MPLKATTFFEPMISEDRQAMGVWMTDAQTKNGIRVYFPYSVLWSFDQTKLQDLQSAAAIMKANRMHFESLASAQFDKIGPNEGETYQGQPVVTVKS
jgi:hypothetical protein